MSPISSIHTVLLIDDDHDDCYLFAEAIEKNFPAARLVTANNFLEAIAFLSLEKSDVIFLDLNMPLKNGFDALSELKVNEDFKEIPVIIFSNSDYAKDIKLAYEKGAALYFPKPSLFDNLLLGLKQILSKDWSCPAVITEKQFVNGKYEPFTLETV